ncbi:MAG: MATE family efflux transporter [Paracoccaceae bacterium]
MRHVTVMALSGTLGLMFTFLIDFLALWWIARLKREELVAAVGIAGTIQFAVISVAIGMMIATVALVSRAIGQGDRQKARRIAGSGVVMATGVLTVIALLAAAFRGPIVAASGGSGAVAEAAELFMLLSLPSIPFLALGILGSSVLRAVGDAWRSMAVTMAAGAVAAVLDPILIVWLRWDVAGAALSIDIARIVMAALALTWAIRAHDLLAVPSLADIREFLSPYLALALPAIATQLSTPFGSWILTREMAGLGESATAGWGVVLRLTILAFGGIFALSGAIGGIIGQNLGAGRPDRVAEAFLAALKFCLAYTVVVWALMAALAGPIVATFGLSAQGADVVRTFTHFAAGSFAFTGALFVSNAAFNNLGRPLRATAANWSRDGLLMYPFALAGAALFGATGIVLAQAFANVIVGGLAAWAAWAFIRGMPARAPAPRQG